MHLASHDGCLAAVPRLSSELRAEYLEFYRILPIESSAEGVLVGTWGEEPDPRSVADLRRVFGAAIRLVRVDAAEAVQAVRRIYGDAGSAQQLIDRLADEGEEAVVEASIDDLVAGANEAPVVQLVNLLLVEAIEARASDIHLESTPRGLRTRYRIDGVLQSAASPPTAYQAPVVSRLKIMAELDIAERRLPQDGRIKLRMQGREIDVRVSTLPSLHGEDVVLRLLDTSRTRLRISDLAMPAAVEDQFGQLIRQPHGLILVTGPTGSGKTTTLYAAVEEIRSEQTKILTVEDPVEYGVAGVTQVHVSSRIGLTFGTALRAFLRQDPDVILVGEIRDPETAEVAAHAALTGHLVMSTLHTRDAVSAVTRLMDLGLPPYLVASTLDAVLAQRLVRRICHHCAGVRTLRAEDVAALHHHLQLGETSAVPVGCEQCRNTGFSGRAGIYELLIVDDDLRTRVSENNVTASILRREARENGLITLLADAARLVRSGTTSIEEVLRVTAS